MKLKILFLTEYFHPDATGGTGTVLSQLARRLQDHENLQISVLTGAYIYRGTPTRPLARRDTWRGVRIHRLLTPKSNRPSAVLRLLAGALFTLRAFLKLLILPKPDVLFVVTNPPLVPMAARLYARVRGVPYVYLIHDLFPDVAVALGTISKDGRIARVWRKFQRGWLHDAARVLVLGRDMAAHLERAYDLPPERIEVLTNWSDPNRIAPRSRDTQFRARHDLRGFVVLYAGNFGQYQDFETLLQAAQNTPDATYVFVGDGARRDDLQMPTQNIPNTRLFPFVPPEEFADLLATADVSLVTLEPGADGLGVPSKFYNILASGRPTLAVVADNSEVARTVRELDAGVVVPQSRPDLLAEAVRDLMRDEETRLRLGRNARTGFEAHFTIGTIAARYAALLREVAHGK